MLKFYQSNMAKPKGFGFMCWLGLILNGFGILASSAILLYGIFYEYLDLPSPEDIGLYGPNMDLKIYFFMIIASGYQIKALASMLWERKNEIRALLAAVFATLVLQLVDAIFGGGSQGEQFVAIGIALVLAVIPLSYFTRPSVYEYLRSEK